MTLTANRVAALALAAVALCYAPAPVVAQALKRDLTRYDRIGPFDVAVNQVETRTGKSVYDVFEQIREFIWRNWHRQRRAFFKITLRGVEGVPVMTFHRWAVRVVYDLFPKLPSQISEETPPLVSRVKNHPAMLESVAGLAIEVTARIDAKLRTAMARWPEGERVVEAWDATKGAPDRRVTQLAQWLTGKRDIKGAKPVGDLPNVTKSAVATP